MVTLDRLTLGLSAVAALASPLAAEVAVVDGSGGVSALTYDGQYCDIRARLQFPLPGWTALPGQGDSRDRRVSQDDGRTTYSGRVPITEGKHCRYTVTMQETDGALRAEYAIEAEDDVALEGAYLFIDVPIAEFTGGMVSMGGLDMMGVKLPTEKPPARHFLSATAMRAVFEDADANKKLELTFEPSVNATVQDTREWNGTDYSLFFPLAQGSLRKGQSARVAVTYKITGTADHSPVTLTLDAQNVRYRLGGFGGDYCFGIESPVTQYTLSTLNVRYARTEMTPAEWEPENDNESPDDTDLAKLSANDKPDSNLRREFELAKQIQGKGIPYAISIWILPEWLYSDPGKGPDAYGRVVPREKWPELLECIGSYLLYAKQQYGVEPNWFSFNEPDYGVRVKLTPEDHRDAIKAFGRHFAALGLRTKMLLADVAQPRGTVSYCTPTVEDAEALQYVGAVAYHSWGRATREQYEEWADLAERLGLPLLITELGTDASAWQTSAYDSYRYAIDEVRLYQELLLYARPTGTMQWEFTNDYGIARAAPEGVQPTVRYWFVKHFCNLTPPDAGALVTTSDSDDVLFTAFEGEVDGERRLTLHIANCGPEREVTMRGVPEAVGALSVVQTSETVAFETLAAPAIEGGEVRLTLPAQSLTTLTNVVP